MAVELKVDQQNKYNIRVSKLDSLVFDSWVGLTNGLAGFICKRVRETRKRFVVSS